MKKEFKNIGFVYIHDFINQQDLTEPQKKLLSVIYGYTHKGKARFYGGNEYMADILCVSKRTAMKIANDLVRLNLITRIIHSTNSANRYIVNEISIKYMQECCRIEEFMCHNVLEEGNAKIIETLRNEKFCKPINMGVAKIAIQDKRIANNDTRIAEVATCIAEVAMSTYRDNNKDNNKDKRETEKVSPSLSSTNLEKKETQNIDVLFPVEEEKKKKEKESSAKEKEKRFMPADFKRILLEMGANEMHVDDWITARKAKRASQTRSALNRFLNECKKHNYPVSDAVKICAEKSWITFEYGWLGIAQEEAKENPHADYWANMIKKQKDKR